MTGTDFTAWMAHMKLGVGEAARLLGLGRNTVPRYMQDGAPDHVAYACSAIAHGLPKWRKID